MLTIHNLLGIKYPILQGAMAHVSTASLVIAVSEAGGLGILASGGFSAQEFRDNIHKIKAATDKPYAVNLALSYPNIDEIIDVAIDEKVEIVTAGGGNPAPYFPKWLEAGFKVIPVVGNSKMAKKVQDLGAIACIFEGAEAGGHIGALNTMAALPAVAEAVDIPVISAGGIGSGKQILAAEILGAQGVQMGTRFLASNECEVHENMKEAVLQAQDYDITVTGYMSHPVRVLKNAFTQKYTALEKEGKTEELEELATGGSRRAARQGDMEWGSVMVGQSVSNIKKRESVEEIIQKVLKEYQEAKDSIQ